MNNPLTRAQITSLSKKEFLADNDTINLYDWLQQALDILDIAALPSQTSNSGKYLTTNGTVLSWSTLPSQLPLQAFNSGKYLTTDGNTASWGTITIPAAVTPGGSTTQIQFNSSSTFAGTSEMTWDATNKRVSLNGIVITKGGTGGSQSSTNLAIGVNMSSALNTGGGNLAIGQNALSAITGNLSNVAIGSGALRSISYAIGGDSDNNVALGFEAGRNRVLGGSLSNTKNSIFIGYQSKGVNVVSPTPDNQIVIGAQAEGDGSNTIRLGNTSITDLRTSGAITSKYSYYGTGSPEGVVTADIGSFYSRTDGGAGTSFYVKESGMATNTGWIAK